MSLRETLVRKRQRPNGPPIDHERFQDTTVEDVKDLDPIATLVDHFRANFPVPLAGPGTSKGKAVLRIKPGDADCDATPQLVLSSSMRHAMLQLSHSGVPPKDIIQAGGWIAAESLVASILNRTLAKTINELLERAYQPADTNTLKKVADSVIKNMPIIPGDSPDTRAVREAFINSLHELPNLYKDEPAVKGLVHECTSRIIKTITAGEGPVGAEVITHHRQSRKTPINPCEAINPEQESRTGRTKKNVRNAIIAAIIASAPTGSGTASADTNLPPGAVFNHEETGSNGSMTDPDNTIDSSAGAVVLPKKATTKFAQPDNQHSEGFYSTDPDREPILDTRYLIDDQTLYNFISILQEDGDQAAIDFMQEQMPKPATPLTSIDSGFNDILINKTNEYESLGYNNHVKLLLSLLTVGREDSNFFEQQTIINYIEQLSNQDSLFAEEVKANMLKLDKTFKKSDDVKYDALSATPTRYDTILRILALLEATSSEIEKSLTTTKTPSEENAPPNTPNETNPPANDGDQPPTEHEPTNSEYKQLLLSAIDQAATENQWSQEKRDIILELANYEDMTPYMIAGICGYLYGESKYDMTIIEDGWGIGAYLAQWSYSRRDDIEKAAREAGINLSIASPENMKFQIKFLVNEMKTRTLRPGGKYASQQFASEFELYKWMETNKMTIEDISRAVLYHYGRPANIGNDTATRFNDREREANNIFTQIRANMSSSEAPKPDRGIPAGLNPDNFVGSLAKTGKNRTPYKEIIINQGYENGQLPDEVLQQLPYNNYRGQPERISSIAYEAYMAMNEEFKEAFGIDIPLTDAYRPYAEQVIVHGNSRPGYAAVPGKSNHGWALAVDINGITSHDNPHFVWLKENAIRFGFVNPPFAQNPDTFEPWHWEYWLDYKLTRKDIYGVAA